MRYLLRLLDDVSLEGMWSLHKTQRCWLCLDQYTCNLGCLMLQSLRGIRS